MRVLKTATKVVVGFVLSIAVLSTALLLSLRLEPVRELIRERANAELAELFRGRIVIDRIGRVDLDGISGLDLRLIDPKGRTVVEADGVSIELFWPGLLWEAVVERPETLSVLVDRLSVDHVRVRLVDDGSGAPSLVRAFEPTTSSPSDQAGSSTRVVISDILVRHAWVHGDLSSAPALDAEIHGLQGSFSTGPQQTDVELDSARLQARNLPGGALLSGNIEGAARIPSGDAPDRLVRLEFEGAFAGGPLRVQFELEGKRVALELDAESIEPRFLSEFAPRVSFESSLSLHAGIEGTLPELAFQFAVTGEPGSILGTGRVHVTEPLAITLNLEAEQVDVGEFVQAAPSTTIALDATVKLRQLEGGGISASYRLTTPGVIIGNQNLPELRLTGEASWTASGRLEATGKLEVDEPGAEAVLTFSVRRAGTGAGLGSEGSIEVDGEVRVKDPPRLSELVPGVRVNGSLEFQGELRPATAQLQAAVRGQFQRISGSMVRARGVSLRASAEGRLSNPRLSVDAMVRRLTLAGRTFTNVDLAARGTQRLLDTRLMLHGTDPERIEVGAKLDLRGRPEVRDLRAVVVNDSERARLSADSITISSEGFRVDELVLTGAGRATASLRWANGAERLTLRTEALNLSRLAQLIGMEIPAAPDHASLTLQYARRAGRPIASLSGWVGGIALGADGHQAAIRFDFALANETVSGALQFRTEGARLLLVAEELLLPELPLDRADLDRTGGSLRVEGIAELAGLESLLVRYLPITSASGAVRFEAELRMREILGPPRLSAELSTHSLELTGRPRLGQPEARAPPWTVEDLDVDAEALVDPNAGLVRARAHFEDGAGTLLVARAAAEPQATQSLRSFLETDWSQVPIDAQVAVPPRRMQSLPEFLRMAALRGVVAGDLAITGTASSPRLSAEANVHCLSSVGMEQMVNVDLSFRHSDEGGSVSVLARSRERPLGELEGRWRGNLLALADTPKDAGSPVRGDLDLELHRFPLSLLPPLVEQQVAGELSGTLALENFGQHAELSARLWSEQLFVGGLELEHLQALLETKGNRLVASLEVGEEPGIGAGTAQALVSLPFEWSRHVLPEADPVLDLRVTASGFRLGAFYPLVATNVSELDGRLDAEIRGRVSPDEQAFTGYAVVNEGVVHVPELGQRFHGIEARVRLEGDQLTLEQFRANAVSGALTATGSAQLDELSIRTARAAVRIERGQSIPLTIEGSVIGDAWGRMEMRLWTSENEPEVRMQVDVPEFHLDMPPTNPAVLQDLEAPQAIRTGTWLPGGRFVPLPLGPIEENLEEEPSFTLIQVNLGRSVWVRRGQELEAQLRGDLSVLSDGDLVVNGKIELVGGFLDVSGKRFEIERGALTFAETADPSNPTITAVARWDSPTEYTIYAEYSGTAEEGRLVLRSDPSLTDQQILSFLLFGSPEGMFGAGSGNTAATAVGVAGGTAAQGLNRVIANFTNLDVSARIDTSTGVARPELVAQLTPRVTVRLTRAIGDPTSAQNPDLTYLTVNLRLRRHWLLSAVVGDRGASALELLWRRTY